MIVNWSFSALEMMAELHEYLGEQSEQIADNYINGIYDSVKKLEEHPESCGPCVIKTLGDQGYRCCKYKEYLIIYKFDGQVVNILAVIHSRRNPKAFEEILSK